MRAFHLAILICVASTAVPAAAQGHGRLTLFSNNGFSGARFTATSQRNNLNIHFRVRSVRISGGQRWQLCRQRNLRDCTTFRSSMRRTSMMVRSVRPRW